ncbi:MAG: GTP-binding protein [Christensenellales bacterium]|jgi:ribosomal protection tetracycline resistance protein
MTPMNLGIVAHVDAGKTTLTEQLLYLTGSIRQAGSVDKGTTQTDYMEIERRRGISVRAVSTRMTYRDRVINLIDTPGHRDFAGEVEGVLRVLDAAVLVLSAAQPLPAQAEALYEALHALGVPVFVFINKVDVVSADVPGLMASLRERLAGEPALLQDPEACLETVAGLDEALLEDYVEGRPIAPDRARSALTAQLRAGSTYAVLAGAALKGQGVARLLDAIVALIPPEDGAAEARPFAGLVFKVEQDRTLGRLAHVRLYGGRVAARDMVYNATRDVSTKVTQLRQIQARRLIDIPFAQAGDIAALAGLTGVRVGDVLGDAAQVPRAIDLVQPLLRVQVVFDQPEKLPELAAALDELAAEDMHLQVDYIAQAKQIQIGVSGLMQLEILQSALQERYGFEVSFSAPTVIYKETPLKAGTGFVAYTMPKPCWAVIEFYLEPGPLGSGVRFVNAVKNSDDFRVRYQKMVERTVPKALRQGPLGWEVTDLTVTLVGGQSHIFHTHPLDFIVATPMAMMDGLARVGTGLLEPMLQARITLPEALSGKLLSELIRLRGTYEAPIARDGMVTVDSLVPVATTMDLPTRLASLSGGRASYSARFAGYQPCALELGATTPYRGVNPLDQAKYILSIRGALTENSL